MAPLFRDAIPDDLSPLAELARATFIATYAHTFAPGDLEAHLEAKLSDACVAGWIADDRVLLAVGDDGALLGFAQIAAAQPEGFAGLPRPGDIALQRLYVSDTARGRGIGASLIASVLAAAPADADVYLDVWVENLGAQRLYARHGFGIVGKKVFETKSGINAGDDLVMVRRAQGQAGSRAGRPTSEGSASLRSGCLAR